MPSSMYKLTVRKGPQQGQAYPLVSSMITVGRDPMADIVIADPEVSRQHARFTRTADGYEIQDLGSTNGTFVDGQRLTGDPVPLQSGQAISMGTNVTLVFEAAADPMATVVSSEPELDIPEPPAQEQGEEEEQEQPPAPAETPEPLPSTSPFEEEEEEPDAEATALEFPSFEEEEEAAFDAGDEEDELPSFGEPDIPEPAPYEPSPEERTILDTEPESPAYSYDEPEEKAGDLPSFGSEQPGQEAPAQQPIAEAHDELPPPPPSPPDAPNGGDNRNRNIIIAVVVILLLLCCCCIIAYGGWIYGDAIMQELGLY